MKSSKITTYDSTLSVEENAANNNVTTAAIRSYIQKRGIDRATDRQIYLYKKVKEYAKEHPKESNHPKPTALPISLSHPTFACKKSMFNLNESNRIFMSQYPSDMRIGVNGMCGHVRRVGLDPSDGTVYIFVGKRRNVMKLLHWERGGYVMYYKRLEQGRFHPRIFHLHSTGFRSMRWDELVLLMEGISPKVSRRHRYEKESEISSSDDSNNPLKVWLSR